MLNTVYRTECTTYTESRTTKTSVTRLVIVDFRELTHGRTHLLADVGLFELGCSFTGDRMNWSDLVSYIMRTLTDVIGLERRSASLSDESDYVIEIELPFAYDNKKAKALIDETIGQQGINVQTFS